MRCALALGLILLVTGCRTEPADGAPASGGTEASGAAVDSAGLATMPDVSEPAAQSDASTQPRIASDARTTRTGRLGGVYDDEASCTIDMDIDGEPFLFMATPEACGAARPLVDQEVDVTQAEAVVGERNSEAVLVVGVAAAE